MPKFTLGQLARLRDEPGRPGPLSRLSTVGDPVSFAHRLLISRFLKAVLRDLNEFEASALKLGQKYGHPSPAHGNQIVVEGENKAPYLAEIAELEAVESGEISPLPIAALEKTNLTPRDLLLLESFIVEPASASPPSLLDPTP